MDLAQCSCLCPLVFNSGCTHVEYVCFHVLHLTLGIPISRVTCSFDTVSPDEAGYKQSQLLHGMQDYDEGSAFATFDRSEERGDTLLANASPRDHGERSACEFVLPCICRIRPSFGDEVVWIDEIVRADRNSCLRCISKKIRSIILECTHSSLKVLAVD